MEASVDTRLLIMEELRAILTGLDGIRAIMCQMGATFDRIETRLGLPDPEH